MIGVETEITSDANGVFTVGNPDKVGTYCLIVRHVTNDKRTGRHFRRQKLHNYTLL